MAGRLHLGAVPAAARFLGPCAGLEGAGPAPCSGDADLPAPCPCLACCCLCCRWQQALSCNSCTMAVGEHQPLGSSTHSRCSRTVSALSALAIARAVSTAAPHQQQQRNRCRSHTPALSSTRISLLLHNSITAAGKSLPSFLPHAQHTRARCWSAVLLQARTSASARARRVARRRLSTPSPRRTGMTSRPPPCLQCATWARPWSHAHRAPRCV